MASIHRSSFGLDYNDRLFHYTTETMLPMLFVLFCCNGNGRNLEQIGASVETDVPSGNAPLAAPSQLYIYI